MSSEKDWNKIFWAKIYSEAIAKLDVNPYDYSAIYDIGRYYEFNTSEYVSGVFAFNYYIKAAEKGFALAKIAVGRCYKNGFGVKEDYEKAFYWHNEAAFDGNAYAKFYLAGLYYEGCGIQRSVPRSIALYFEAAEQGCKEAKYVILSDAFIFELAKCINEGFEFDSNFLKAFNKFRRKYKNYNQNHNSLKSFNDNAEALLKGGLVIGAFSEWSYVAKTVDGDVNEIAKAKFMLGQCYKFGVTCVAEKDVWTAFLLFYDAARNGCEVANKILADADFQNEILKSTSDKSSFAWRSFVSESVCMDAQFDLASYLHRNPNYQNNILEALYWYRKANDYGHAGARSMLLNPEFQNDVAKQYYNLGQTELAQRWFESAAGAGHEEAQFNLNKLRARQEKHLSKSSLEIPSGKLLIEAVEKVQAVGRSGSVPCKPLSKI